MENAEFGTKVAHIVRDKDSIFPSPCGTSMWGNLYGISL
jgi:hypothetical protein